MNLASDHIWKGDPKDRDFWKHDQTERFSFLREFFLKDSKDLQLAKHTTRHSVIDHSPRFPLDSTLPL